MKTYSLGIDIGYSTVKATIIDNKNKLAFEQYQQHKGQIKETLDYILSKIDKGFNPSEISHGAITGSLSKQITQELGLNRVNEVSAAIEGATYLHPSAKSIIEIGGQSAKYFTGFNTQEPYTLRISRKSMLKIASNSDCAAGTGSFLEEQASRLDIKIKDYSQHAQKAKSIPRIAGRCSVFTKTDIIHHQQEGVPSEDILKGVAYAIVKNYKSAVIRRLPIESPVLFIGGVAKNQTIIDALRDVLQKNKSELIVPEHFDVTNSIGAALIARKDNLRMDFRKVFWDFSRMDQADTEDFDSDDLPPLSQIEPEDITKKHEILPLNHTTSVRDCFLGIDIGSTSTNLVLINSDGGIVNYKYMRTMGNPLKAVQQGLIKINSKLEGNLVISGVGVTGSGRHLIGKQIGADIIKDEITAQAKAAVKIDPEVDTIFEIGGQDSKYISINNGAVTDFQMNKVCAAGTGSFLEEQALKFNIPVDQLGQLALKGEHPVVLGERCTVFIESSIASSLSRGKKTEDIVSGLCYSIAKNYLHRVVGQKKIGKRIFLQGGIAFNQGVANALKILTQKDIKTSPFFSVTGAYGAAILALEEMKGRKSKFKGFEQFLDLSLAFKKSLKEAMPIDTDKYKAQTEKLIFEDYDGSIDPKKKTVGIPRSLFSYSMFPMYNSFFKNLGLNVLLSGWSNEGTIKLGQEYSLEETCFPMKLVTGHVAELVEKGVDYIFFPNIYNVSKPASKSRQVYGCAYMQQAGKIIEISVELKKKGIELLSPTVAFKQGSDFMKKSFLELGKQLGKTNETEVNLALQKGMEANQHFELKVIERRKGLVNKIKKDKISFVIISKMYGVSDPALNLGIPDKLMDMGYSVIPFYELPQSDISKDHPNMFWSFGQPILSSAYFVRDQPNLYAILLTHHGCGPDSVLTHFFQEIMGDKPYLNIEIDEHASKIGVITRLEAFVNSLKYGEQETTENIGSTRKTIRAGELLITQSFNHLSSNTKIYIPNLFPFSDLLKEVFSRKGNLVEVLPQANAKTVNLGRKYTLTNEYYSMTSLLGDCFTKLENRNGDKNIAFLIPQTEGAEIGAQYNRLLRTKLDEGNYSDVQVLAPFLEDILKMEKADSSMVLRCLLAGDMIRAAPPEKRAKYLELVKTLIQEDVFDIANLCLIAKGLYSQFRITKKQKRILAIGEPMIVFNDFLNGYTFKNLEDQNQKVIYFSFAEAVWMFLNDFVHQNTKMDSVKNLELLSVFKEEIKSIAKELKEESPFVNKIEDLVKTADDTTGLYAGEFARYRQAKVLLTSSNINGIITANSTYENTGISLNILHKEFSNGSAKPILNLTFDGNNNENDKSKLESFMYYL